MTALPAKAGISAPYPNPKNSIARAAFAQFFDAVSEAIEKPELDLASATTCDIGGQLSTKLRITGATTITSFGTNFRGPIFLRMAGALTITHNSTTMICPGSTSITTAAGDVLMAWPKSTASGTADGWQVVRLSGGYGPTFSAYATTDQSVSSGVNTKVTLGTEDFDTAGCFASSRFTPNVPGYYLINGAVKGNSATMTEIIATVFKNGSLYHTGQADVFAATSKSTTATVSIVMYMNGTTDYVELYGQITGGTPKFAYTSIGNSSRLSGCLLRPA